MKTRLFKILSGLLIAFYISTLFLSGAALARSTPAKSEPKRGVNPQTGRLSFIGGGDPIFVTGVSGAKGLSAQDRAHDMANVYGREFGLKNPSQDLKPVKAQKDSNGKTIVRFQQMYRDVPVYAGEMLVNTNGEGELLSISGEVSPDLTLSTKPEVTAQQARKAGLEEIASLYQMDARDLHVSDPELWIFDQSLLEASTRPAELVWRMEVRASDFTQPIRELVMVNAQTGAVTWHINQVDGQASTWPVYFDLELDEVRGWMYGSDPTGNKIDVISISTLAIVKSFTLASGADPKGIALSPDGAELAVAQYGTPSILFLNPDSGQTVATVVPNAYPYGKPWDVIYGRSGRLYSSGYGDYIHVINTTSHLEVSRSTTTAGGSPYLAISSNKNVLFANSNYSPNSLYRFDVSTDTLPAPISTNNSPYDFSAKTFVLSSDDSKIFTSNNQVWKSDLSSKVGEFTPAVDSNGIIQFGRPAILPQHDAVALAVDNSYGNDVLAFASTNDFYTLTRYTLPVAGTLGALIANQAGSKLYLSSSNGVMAFDLKPSLPGTSVPLPSGPLPYYDLAIDQARRVLYGSDWFSDKVDVISLSTLKVIKSFRLVNGAGPKGLALSPDGSELAVAQVDSGGLLFLDPDTGATLATIPGRTSDVVYGRTNRLYASRSGLVDVFDTSTHTKISTTPGTSYYASYLTLSSDKNTLYMNGTDTLHKLNVSTDTLPVPTRMTATSYFSSNASILLVDDSKIFTDYSQVWSTDFQSQLGSIEPGATLKRTLAALPNRNVIAVGTDNSSGNDTVWFVNTDNFYTLNKYTLPSTDALGPMIASADGSQLYLSTTAGISSLSLTPTLPGSPAPLPSGALPYADVVLDEPRGVLYGADMTGNKIDVLSAASLQVVKSYRLVNGAKPKAIALSPDGSELAIAQSSASSILFLNADTGEVLSKVVPNTPNSIPTPSDVIYGRTGRLYSAGNEYIHVIDTVPHTEISKSSRSAGTGTSLALSSDKNYLYTNSINKFDVSTDTFLTPIKTAYLSTNPANSIVLVDNTKIFTDRKYVWNSDLNAVLGAITPNGLPANLPGHGAVAVGIDNSSGNDAVSFIRSDDFYTTSTYTLPTSGTLGPLVASGDGNKLFISTSTGLQMLDLSASLPGTPVPLPSGPLPYFDLIVDPVRGVLYGSDTTGNKIDVISSSSLQVLKSFRLSNGASPYGIALSPDGSELAVAQGGLYSLLFLDVNTGGTIATLPLLVNGGQPYDLIYGRPGRLYSSGLNESYIHIIDTVTHTEINKFSGQYGSPTLALTSDKNSLFVHGGSSSMARFNVATDTPAQTASSYSISASTYLLLADDSRIFTNTGQAWSANLATKLGTFGASGRLAEVPQLGMVAVLSTSSPGLITFVRTSDYATASTFRLPSITAVGASPVSPVGDTLFVNTNSGIKAVSLDPTVPSSISAYSGAPRSVQVLRTFLDPLKVKVQNILGDPIPGIVVTLTAPASGASGVFADTGTNITTAVTDANGIASASLFTANSTAGIYVVKATVPDLLASADFQLTNLAAVTCNLSGPGTGFIFRPYQQFDCGVDGYAVGAGDFNHDGRKDVALTARLSSMSSSGLLIFTQLENGTLSQPDLYPSGNRSESMVAGDINSDGLDDVVTADFSDNSISVFLQRQDGILANRITYATDTGPDTMAIGDVNGDGRKDIVVSHWNSATIGVFLQNSDGTLASMVPYAAVSSGLNDIAIGDVNGDGLNDVVRMNGSGLNGNLLVYLQNSGHTLDSYTMYSLTGCSSFCMGHGVGVGDVTGDGRADMVMSYGGNSPTGKVAVFAQDANGNLQPAISYPSYDIPEPVEIGDVNSDGLQDVVVVHGGWETAGVYLQGPEGTLGAEIFSTIPYTTHYESQALALDDINQDQQPDLLLADGSGLVVLYRYETILPTETPWPTPTYGPGPTRTPRPTSTAGPSPTAVPPSSTGNRQTFTASGTSNLPGSLLCDQSQSSCTNGADPDADAAHQYAADTFMFYNTHHGRNSFDGQGGTIISTVHLGIGYQNAFWNGIQVVYGDHMAADDVVGHEISHGVTEYSSNLIYYGQSGAINESLSDVWGEFIDQTNGAGNDTTAVKWLLGEDTALGVIRSMSNPPAYGSPDKMSSPYFYTGTYDNGGVHTNSGVNNKAAYLLVEGGEFNGRYIGAIGMNKTAAVYYETQANLLTAGANYSDLYYALMQACQNLTGGAEGITADDCLQVQLATEAVEMISVPVPTPTTPPTDTFTPTASLTPSITPTFTITSTPTRTFTPSPTFTKTRTPTATKKSGPMKPTSTPTVKSTAVPSKTPRKSSFADVPSGHVYFDDIEILYANGLTGGCSTSPLSFCPDQIMNRGQAAVFMLRGNLGNSFVPDPASHIFQDDWSGGAWAESWAEAMRNTGLSSGCLASPLKYCPWDQIPREQAVIFALRLKYGNDYQPPAATGTLFADMTDVNYYATAWTEQAYRDGLIPSCGTSKNKPMICPKALVSRGMAAYMIVRAKNLTMP